MKVNFVQGSTSIGSFICCENFEIWIPSDFRLKTYYTLYAKKGRGRGAGQNIIAIIF